MKREHRVECERCGDVICYVTLVRALDPGRAFHALRALGADAVTLVRAAQPLDGGPLEIAAHQAELARARVDRFSHLSSHQVQWTAQAAGPVDRTPDHQGRKWQ